jgi:hypothetical protein
MVSKTAWIVAIALTMKGGLCMADGFVPQLASVTLSTSVAHPGDTVLAALEFVNVGDSAADRPLRVFVHVRPAGAAEPDAGPALGADFVPALPTFLWLPGRKVVESAKPISIPASFAPGEYSIYMGVFDPASGRITLANPDQHAGGMRYKVASLRVAGAGEELKPEPCEARFADTAALPPALAPSTPDLNGPSVRLRSEQAEVILSAAEPRVLQYQVQGGVLNGDSLGLPLWARVCRDGGEEMRCVALNAGPPAQVADNEARYVRQVTVGGAVAASFEVVFRLQGDALRTRLENVQERQGWLLMEVSLPQLVSAWAPAGQIAIPYQCGRLVPLGRTAPGAHEVRMDWYEMDLCGAVIGSRCAAAIRSRDWDNVLVAQVGGEPGRLCGGFSVRMPLRADASAKAGRVRLAESPSVEIGLVALTHGTDAAWVDCAHWLRKDLVGGPPEVYRDTLIYKIFCDTPGAKGYTTFAQAAGLMGRIHAMAPWLKQVAYLVGWQYEGHDTGYPATDRINQRLGGAEGLARAAKDAAAANAVLSYHDNFDDAYQSSPQWDPEVIARDVGGELQKGGVWAGGQSYILAFGKYVARYGLERVRRTLAQMPVRESYHIDVLSAVPLRRDYNPQSPESTRDSIAAKTAIVREFNRHGVDVTSEGFTAPFVGVIGHGWHCWQRPDTAFIGEERIPLIPMIYHGGPTSYGTHATAPTQVQDSCLYGASIARDWSAGTDLHNIAEDVYLIVVPWTHLRTRRMEGYQRTGDVERVIYDPQTYVEVNRATGAWEVRVDGRTLARDGLLTERRPGLLAVFSRTAQEVTVELPADLRGKALVARNGITGAEEPVTEGNGQVRLNLAAREPVLVSEAQ